MTNYLKPYYELIKSSIVYLVVVTTAFGYYLSEGKINDYVNFGLTLISALLVCAGVCALNQVIEWRDDLKMERTKNRPIPRGAISPLLGYIFSFLLIFTGLYIMYFYISPLMALGGGVTSALYILVYTPLKKVTWLNTFIGAIPGALPPLGGWLAATGEITWGGLLLFLVLFLWQHPHFFIIAWLCKDDYVRGGFKMISNRELSGDGTFRQIIIYSLLLIISSLLLAGIDQLNWIYLSGALILGLWFLWQSIQVFQDRSIPSAKRFLKTTVFYLPGLFIVALVDMWTF